MRKGFKDRYFVKGSMAVAQGFTVAVQDKGSLRQYVLHLIQGVRHGVQDFGVDSLKKC